MADDHDNKMRFPNETSAYRAARDRLLQSEIALRRQMEAVAAERRALPRGGNIKEDYIFDGVGPDGSACKVRLSQLFRAGTDTLVVYNMMFPRWSTDRRPQPARGVLAGVPMKETPCPSCVAFIDELARPIANFQSGGFSFAIVAKAPIDRVARFADERGWADLTFVSSAANSFKVDYRAESAEGEQEPMMNVFVRDAEGIHHFWSSEMLHATSDPGQDPRHNGTLEAMWNMVDLTPGGRSAYNPTPVDGCCA